MEVEHGIEARVGPIALGALGLEAHPELKALHVAQMLAKWELLQTISVSVIVEADKAAYDAMICKLIPIRDHAHLNKVVLINTLLNHVIDAILPQRLHCGLMLRNSLLYVLYGCLIHLLGHLRVVIVLAQHLQCGLFDLGGLFYLGVAIADQADVAEDEDVG